MERMPFEDAIITLSEAQNQALAQLAICDHDQRMIVENHIRSWDKALNRGDTIEAQRRNARAQRVWENWIFEGGLGI